jgi:glycerol uptake facilitator-like aquaporin
VSQWVSEAVATFALLFAILGTIRARPDAVPVAVALVIVSAYWFTASTSFANPAVSIARALSDTFADIAPSDVPAFIVAQLCGGGLALIVAQVGFGWTADPESDPRVAVNSKPVPRGCSGAL